jgi:hypothetical protein
MTLPRSSSQQNSANPCRRWQVAGTEVPLPLHLRLGPDTNVCRLVLLHLKEAEAADLGVGDLRARAAPAYGELDSKAISATHGNLGGRFSMSCLPQWIAAGMARIRSAT